MSFSSEFVQLFFIRNVIFSFSKVGPDSVDQQYRERIANGNVIVSIFHGKFLLKL